MEDDKQGRAAVAKAFLFFVLVLIVVGFATGCASALEKHADTCFALDGLPSYTKSGSVEKFSCERSGILTRASR